MIPRLARGVLAEQISCPRSRAKFATSSRPAGRNRARVVPLDAVSVRPGEHDACRPSVFAGVVSASGVIALRAVVLRQFRVGPGRPGKCRQSSRVSRFGRVRRARRPFPPSFPSIRPIPPFHPPCRVRWKKANGVPSRVVHDDAERFWSIQRAESSAPMDRGRSYKNRRPQPTVSYTMHRHFRRRARLRSRACAQTASGRAWPVLRATFHVPVR